MVLGHAHADHRGTAPYMDVPVLCHPDEEADAESDAAIAPYMDLSQLPVAWVRWIYPFLLRRWDGGAVKIADTVIEGDEVAGFKVIHFPGHAPGLIGLWRESDRVALVSDVVYLVDSARLKPLPEGEASVPHPAWAWDHAKAKESVRRLAALEPRVVGAGHEHPLRGENLRETLEAGRREVLNTAPAAYKLPAPDDRDLRLGGADLRRLAAGRPRRPLARRRREWSLAGAGGRLRRRADGDRRAGAGAGARDLGDPRRRGAARGRGAGASGGGVRPLRQRPRRTPGCAAKGCRWRSSSLVVLAIPFAVSGRWGLLGVGFNNDLGLHLAWAEWLRSGFGPAPDPGYPLGPHGLAVATAAVPGIGLGQAFLGEIIAIGVMTGLTALGALREA